MFGLFSISKLHCNSERLNPKAYLDWKKDLQRIFFITIFYDLFLPMAFWKQVKMPHLSSTDITVLSAWLRAILSNRLSEGRQQMSSYLEQTIRLATYLEPLVAHLDAFSIWKPSLWSFDNVQIMITKLSKNDSLNLDCSYMYYKKNMS